MSVCGDDDADGVAGFAECGDGVENGAAEFIGDFLCPVGVGVVYADKFG